MDNKFDQELKSEQKPYTTPELTVYGDVEDITQWTGSGGQLDQSFSGGTDVNSLTFS